MLNRSCKLHTGEKTAQTAEIGSWITTVWDPRTRTCQVSSASMRRNPRSIRVSFCLPRSCRDADRCEWREHVAGDNSQHLRWASAAVSETRTTRFHSIDEPRVTWSERARDAKLEGVIETMELAFRMQAIAPELLDLSNETERTLERYRVGKKLSVGTCRPTDFGRQCLLARRFAEAGVRFIEVNHGSWDQHKDYRRDLKANCETTDAPIAALLEDLAARGLLDETLVVWGGEFGRPGLTPGDGKNETGHNARGFTFWMAGGGVKRGHVHGRTDETGARAVEGKVHFRDLHATILNLVGLQHDQLTFHHEGRDHRLTGPERPGVREIFA